jgi:cytochrome c oxidase cbb3-type subunit 2
MLKIKPRNFTTGIFKFHSTPGADALPTDQDLFVTISHGLWGTPMPPWYDLSAEQRMAVIQFIKTFSMRWLTEEVSAPVAVPPEPEVSVQSINHGHELYATICAFCHGENGHGDGIAGGALTDTWGNPVKPADYTLPAGAPGGVKLGHDGRHLFLTVMNGVGGTPMPAFAANLSPQDVWDTVHFIQSLRVDAHMKELQRAGLSGAKVHEARLKLWQDISAAAAKGGIEAAVQ